MNFLSLCQMTAQKCGMSGASAFVSTVNQTGEFKRLVGWVNEAWMEIQLHRDDWDWMRGSVSFQTVPFQATYTPTQCGVTDLAEWLMNTSFCSFRYYVTSVGVKSEIFLSYMKYDDWRDAFQYNSLRTSYSRPEFITITPDQSIGLGQIPDSTPYTIVGSYFKEATMMAADTDIPGLPTRFHMAIVYKAMMFYGEYEGDEYVRALNERNYNTMLSRLSIAQLPEVTFGATLA